MISLSEGPIEPRMIFGKTSRREVWVTLPAKGVSLLVADHTCPDNYHVQATYQVEKFLIANGMDGLTEHEHHELREVFFGGLKGK